MNKDSEIGRAESKIELAFPKYQEQQEGLVAKGISGEGVIERMSTSLDQISNWFERYQVESIELWINGMIETGGIMKLIVSAKGEGGMKVILKPHNLAGTSK
jgi:hypothetical protein